MLTTRELLIALSAILSFAVLHGVIGGILFTYHHQSLVSEQVRSLKFEIEQSQWMDWFSLPGLPIHDTILPPFYVPKLRSLDWNTKLNLSKPAEHETTDAGVDKMAILDGLTKDMSDPSTPSSSWVYVSYMASPEFDPWDKAFEQLLEYHNLHPAAHNASFGYIEKLGSSFLCSMWRAKVPAMVHFEVQTEDCELKQSVFGARSTKMCPVVARIISLPLESVTIYRDQHPFPSEFEQMLSLTSNEYAYEEYDTYDQMDVVMDRFQDWLDELTSKWRSLDLYFKTVQWVQTSTGLVGVVFDVIEATVLTATIVVGAVVTAIWKMLYELVLAFVGYPGYGGTEPPIEPDHMPGSGANMLENMLGGFIESLQDKIPEENLGGLFESMRDVMYAAPSATES